MLVEGLKTWQVVRFTPQSLYKNIKRGSLIQVGTNHICITQINGKLCFGQPEMIRASQNKLATRLKAREGFPPKSEIHDVKSETENLNAYGRKQ